MSFHILNKSNNILEIEYNTFNSFIQDFLVDRKIIKNLQRYIFRGEKSAKYILVPCALRKEGREIIKKCLLLEMNPKKILVR